MKKTGKVTVLLALFVCAYVSLFSQEDNGAYMELYKPNENHKILYQLQGSWKENISYASTPEPMYTSGETQNEVIFGGRYVKMDGTMQMMGMPVKVTTYMGYDNSKKKFFIFAIDEMSTDPLFADGEYDKAKNQFTFKGTSFDPVKKNNVIFRIVLTFERENKYVYQYFINPGKREIKKMEVIAIKKAE